MAQSNLTPIDHLRFILSRLTSVFTPLCQCSLLSTLPHFKARGPSSPDLLPQEGELETLLSSSGDFGIDDHSWGVGEDEEFSVLRTPRHLKASNGNTFVGDRKPRSFNGSKLRSYPAQNMRYPNPTSDPQSKNDEPPSYDSHSRLKSGTGAEDIDRDLDLDEDAPSLNPSALERMAKQFEPTLTVEDIEREEAEQAERERRAERAGGLDIYSPPLLRAANGDQGGGAEGEEFGDFNQAG